MPIGSVTDTIVIKTDNPKKPEVDVPVVGDVLGRVQPNPKTLNFSPHQEVPVTVTFTVDPPEGFAIRSVSTAKGLVRPYIKRATAVNGTDQYYLVVTVLKDLPKDSDGKDQIFVKTNDPEQPIVTLDVQAGK